MRYSWQAAMRRLKNSMTLATTSALFLESFSVTGSKHDKKRDVRHSIINEIRRKHSRKYGFIGDFERIAAGAAPESPPSFESKMRKRWGKQTK
jgi:hypothetical protein